MNDRYLYRGKCLTGGTWSFGGIVPVNGIYEIHFMENGRLVSCIPDQGTVGQCTGLCDKNGTLIFEGDIVRLDTVSKHRAIGAVRWTEFARYEFWHIRQDQGFQLGQRFDETEIIGNIHDNPELLEAAP